MQRQPNRQLEWQEDLSAVFELDRTPSEVEPRGLIGSLALLVTNDETAARWQTAFTARKAHWRAKWNDIRATLKEKRTAEKTDRHYNGSWEDVGLGDTEQAPEVPTGQLPPSGVPWHELDTKPLPVITRSTYTGAEHTQESSPAPGEVNLARLDTPEINDLATQAVKRARRQLSQDNTPTISMPTYKPEHQRQKEDSTQG